MNSLVKLCCAFAAALVLSIASSSSHEARAATINVNSTADAVSNDGQCTLREAITAAENNAVSGPAAGECGAGSGDDTITFSVTGTINLLNNQLSITSNVSIVGPGSGLLTVRRGGTTLHRIFFVNAATVSISGMTIADGQVNAGGGAGGGLINGGFMTLTDVVVTRNQTSIGTSGAPTGGPGGGIFNVGTLSMTDCTVSDNITGEGVLGAGSAGDGAGGTGGGIFNNGTLTMTDCTVSGNRTGVGPAGGGEGGGIFAGSTTTLTNVTISNNMSASGGGGIRAVGTLTMTNTTVTANTSFTGAGHGVTGGGTGNVRNTIIAGNGSGGAGPDISGPFNSVGNNVIGNGDGGSGFGQSTDQVGNTSAPLNPVLAPLGNYGGPTQTHALLPGSPAIDAGTSTGAPAQDQRGVSRVGPVDIGSFESRGFTIAATAGTPQSTTIKTTFGTPLSATVSSGFGEPVAGGQINFDAPPSSGPSGTFASGLTALHGVTINGSGVATATAFTANGFAGSYVVRASARGIASFASFNLTNTPAATTTAVASSVNPSRFGQPVTFTATVTSSAGTPTGTVQFRDNGVNIGAAVALDSAGRASVTTSALTTGTHTITAVYSGDANFTSSNGTLAGGQTVRPTLSVNDVSVTEGDGGTTDAVFTVTLSSASASDVTVNFATADGTAAAPGDYQPAAGTLTFTAGQTTRTITVAVKGDTSFEADETFFVNLSAPANATVARAQGTGTILNDDPEGGRLRFASATFATTEGSGSATVTVERTGDTSRAVTVDYETSDLSASQRSDYNLTLGKLSFAAGETTKTFAVMINQDSRAEGTEALTLTLSNPGNGAGLGSIASATLEISDDVPESAGSPIDDPGGFVRQHYHDFLNREPDTPGLNFWTNQIAECEQRPEAERQGCREVRRINVSAAFFLSIEFQSTGYLVYRTYKAAYGDIAPDKPVPVRLREFVSDTQEMGRGVIVNVGDWQGQLEANRQAYFEAYVSTARFTTRYPQSMAPAEFVDALDANAGGVLTQAEKDALVSELTSGAKTRATALRAVAESEELRRRELNRAFVLMEYFGYLRRNPDDAPEPGLDFRGYNFWLGKLNNHGGDYIAAEMVKAFIVSSEYRGRFAGQ